MVNLHLAPRLCTSEENTTLKKTQATEESLNYSYISTKSLSVSIQEDPPTVKKPKNATIPPVDNLVERPDTRGIRMAKYLPQNKPFVEMLTALADLINTFTPPS